MICSSSFSRASRFVGRASAIKAFAGCKVLEDLIVFLGILIDLGKRKAEMRAPVHRQALVFEALFQRGNDRIVDRDFL